MTWIKLDDQLFDHPKLVRAGEPAAYLFVAGLLYCSRYLTDGEIPKPAVTRLTVRDDVAVLAEALVRENLWVDEGDSWRVWQYTDYQRSRTDVERSREAGKARADRSRSVRANASRTNASGSREVREGFASGSRDIELEKELDTKPSRAAKIEHDAEFVTWWDAYPRKLGKQKARERYGRLRRTHDAAALLDAARHYAASRSGEDPQFTLHPTSFLNDRWTDWVAGNPDGSREVSERDLCPYYDPDTGQPWGAG